MELKPKYTMVSMNHPPKTHFWYDDQRACILKEIILEELGIDVMERCRKRNIVDARKIFSYILSKSGHYGCSKIARLLNMNHATIIFYLKEIETLLLIDTDVKQDYERVLEAYTRKIAGGELSLMTRLELEKEVERLRANYYELQVDYLKTKDENRRFKNETY